MSKASKGRAVVKDSTGISPSKSKQKGVFKSPSGKRKETNFDSQKNDETPKKPKATAKSKKDSITSPTNFDSQKNDETPKKLKAKVKSEKDSITSPTNFDSQKNDETPKKLKAKAKSEKDSITSPLSSTPLKTTTVVKVQNPEKSKVIDFLQTILSEEIPYKVLTDIQYNKSGIKFTVLGRTEVVGSSTKQMRHITPHSFVKTLIESVIISSASPKLIISSYIPILKLLLKNKTGYCISSEDLELDGYEELASTVPDLARRVVVDKTSFGELFFLSPGKLDDVPSFTPTKQDKATKSFGELNLRYVKAAIERLAESIADNNSAIMTAEILARFIFKIFNSKEGVAFPEEGNTQNFVIRLYDSPEKAKKAGAKTPYKVVSAGQLKEKYYESGPDSINKMIRLVNCEGASTKKVVKALRIIDDIILSHNMGNSDLSKHISLYNKKGNIQLVLANNLISDDYNCPLTKENYLEISLYHSAKLLYYVFDLKALEKDVLAADRRGEILLFENAKSQTLVKYGFEDGAEYRSDEVSRADGRYNKHVKFRAEKTDLNFLASKLVEHFIISTMPLSNFATGFLGKESFLKQSLQVLIDLAILDHGIKKPTQKGFAEEASTLYDKLTKDESAFDFSGAAIKLYSDTDFSGILGSSSSILDELS